MDESERPFPPSDLRSEPAPIRWYSRSALDAYLSDSAAERDRLQAVIDDASNRLASSTAALGLHQTMLEMLLDSQRTIREIRTTADARAAELIAEGQREADAVLTAMRGNGAAGRRVATPPGPVPDGAGAAPVGGPPHDREVRAPSAADDEFFDYLRGALSDDEPLGPMPR